MGQAKKYMMEEEERGYSIDSEKWICADEFPHQSYLRYYIGKSFEDHICSYCGEDKQCLSLNAIVEKVYDAIEEVFEDPSASLPFESSDDTWGDLDGTGLHKEGAGFVLPDHHHIMTTTEALEEAGFEPRTDQIIDDISESIHQGYWVYRDLMYSTDQEILEFNWQTFWENTIKDAKSGKPYEEIKRDNAVHLNFMKEALASNLHALSKEIPKGSELYRCVNYKTVPDPLEAKNLWAPPAKYASSQRMSRNGQSRFYASLDPQTPLKEAVKNTNGETACLGTFALTRSIRILDFTDLPEARLLNCPDLLAYRFFNLFAEDITQPVSDSEKEKYVPTQIMRDIVEDAFSESGILGIKYSSVKGTASQNVVLFLDDTTCAAYLSLKTATQHPPHP